MFKSIKSTESQIFISSMFQVLKSFVLLLSSFKLNSPADFYVEISKVIYFQFFYLCFSFINWVRKGKCGSHMLYVNTYLLQNMTGCQKGKVLLNELWDQGNFWMFWNSKNVLIHNNWLIYWFVCLSRHKYRGLLFM